MNAGVVGRSGGRLLVLASIMTARPPDRLSAQCPDGSPPPCSRPVTAPPPTSVAVLYFDNLSGDTADAYLADGLTEELIVRLGRIDRITLASRTAVRRYRGRSIDNPQTLGRTLGVTYLVNGSVRRSASRLRVTVELVRAATGLRIWGDQYDRMDADLLAVQADIAEAVATPIAGRLAPGERASLAARPTNSPAAFDHFLRGNHYLLQRTPRSLSQAIEAYAAAGRLDPGFVAPLARSAFAYAVMVGSGLGYRGLAPESLLARGFRAADQALRRDSATSDGWTAWGFLTALREAQGFGSARAALERAISLDPRNAESHHMYGTVLLFSGHDSAAGVAARRALALEPDRAITLHGLGVNAFAGRRYGEARLWLDSAIAVDPAFYRSYAFRALVRLQLGDVVGARRDAAAAVQTGAGEALLGQGALAMVEVRAGDTLAARARVERLLSEAPSPTPWAGVQGWHAVAGALIALGDHERALDYLEQVRPRGPYLWFWLSTPEFDPIRQHPRLQRLIEEARPR